MNLRSLCGLHAGSVLTPPRALHVLFARPRLLYANVNFTRLQIVADRRFDASRRLASGEIVSPASGCAREYKREHGTDLGTRFDVDGSPVRGRDLLDDEEAETQAMG